MNGRGWNEKGGKWGKEGKGQRECEERKREDNAVKGNRREKSVEEMVHLARQKRQRRKLKHILKLGGFFTHFSFADESQIGHSRVDLWCVRNKVRRDRYSRKCEAKIATVPRHFAKCSTLWDPVCTSSPIRVKYGTWKWTYSVLFDAQLQLGW